MKPLSILAITLLAFTYNYCLSQTINIDYPKAHVNFQDYEKLVKQVKDVRSKNLISFNQLLEYQNQANTVVLDTRSKEMYDAKHIKGAINLPFTEFTTDNLRAIIPDTNTKIIIYCNNNIENELTLFPTKMFVPQQELNSQKKDESIMLALNIPTYINLYGYGYKNIYELNELVNIFDPRLEFEGCDVIK